jgi:diaminopimelate epimerase
MKLNIDYFSGAGNLFTAVDNKNYRLKKDDFAKFAEILSSENSVTKVKTEGIVVLNPAENADFDVWFFNPD